MKTLGRVALIGVLAGAMQAANAQATFTLVNGYYTLDSSGPFNFNFIPNSVAMTVDIIPTAPAFRVGDSTQFGSGVATIIYNVTSAVPINGIDMLLQGDVAHWGEVNWTETAEVGSTNLGMISGSVLGSNYAGGSDGAYTQTAHLTFSQAVTSFKVKKTFTIDIGANRPPSDSIASVSLIEQNLSPVPEPATLLVVGAGIAAVLRRRKK